MSELSKIRATMAMLQAVHDLVVREGEIYINDVSRKLRISKYKLWKERELFNDLFEDLYFDEDGYIYRIRRVRRNE